MNSRGALEGNCSGARRERTAIGPITAERKVEVATSEGGAGNDVEIAGDDGVALQRLGAGSGYSKLTVCRRVVHRLIACTAVVDCQVRQCLISNRVLR